MRKPRRSYSSARRVIADNHSGTSDGRDVPQSVLDAFTGVDLIVHCGDAGTWGTLDRLATAGLNSDRPYPVKAER